MRKATAISTGLHAAVLLWATLSFSGKTFEVTPAESLPVDMISEKDFSQLTKGAKDAPKLDMPKPLAEKKAEEPPKPVEELETEDYREKRTAGGQGSVAAARSGATQARSDRGEDKAEGRTKAGDQGRSAAATEEAAAAEAAAEIRRRQDRGTARQARSGSAMRRPARNSTRWLRLARLPAWPRNCRSLKLMRCAPG